MQSEVQGHRAKTGIPLASCPLQLAGRESQFCHPPSPLPTAQTPGSSSYYPLAPFGGGQVSAGEMGAQELKGLGAINNRDFPPVSCLSVVMASLAPPQCCGGQDRLA